MTYAIKAPARYAQGAGELANLGRSAKKLGNKFLVICTSIESGRTIPILPPSTSS